MRDAHNNYLAVKRHFKGDRHVLISAMKGAVIGPELWNIIGVTPEALAVFRSHDYRRVARMGVQRGHLKDRATLYARLLDEPEKSYQQFLRLVRSHGKCVFGLSSQNKALDRGECEYIPMDSGDLFPPTLVAWRHNREEREFLRNVDI